MHCFTVWHLLLSLTCCAMSYFVACSFVSQQKTTLELSNVFSFYCFCQLLIGNVGQIILYAVDVA